MECIENNEETTNQENLDIPFLLDYKTVIRNLNEFQKKEDTFLSEEIVLKICNYLSPTEICALSCTSKTLRIITYNPQLWVELDLSYFWKNVNDSFIKILLSTSNRFSKIKSLNLSHCKAITDKTLLTISTHCPELESLNITLCANISSDAFTEFIKAVPNLSKVEFSYCKKIEIRSIEKILRNFPQLDLGHSFFYYCALIKSQPIYAQDTNSTTNILPPQKELSTSENASPSRDLQELIDKNEFLSRPSFTLSNKTRPQVSTTKPFYMGMQPAKCHYENNSSSGSCWGALKSILIHDYSSNTLWNVPIRILFTCTFHFSLVNQSEDFFRCVECRKHIAAVSMFDEVICISCHDRILLAQDDNWIVLNDKMLSKLSLKELCNTMPISKNRYIFKNLTKAGEVRLNFLLTNSDEISLSDFMELNHLRINDCLSDLREVLKTEKSREKSRALLVYSEKKSEIEVYTEDGRISQVTQVRNIQILTNFLYFFWSVFFPLIFAVVIGLFIKQYLEATKVYPNQIINSIAMPSPFIIENINMIIIIGLFFFIISTLIVYILLRSNENLAIQTFYFSVAATIFLNMALVSLHLIYFTIMYKLPLDLLSIIFFSINIAIAHSFAIFFRIQPQMDIILLCISIPLFAILTLNFSSHMQMIIVILVTLLDSVLLFVHDGIISPFLSIRRQRSIPPFLHVKRKNLTVRIFDFAVYGALILLCYKDFSSISFMVFSVISSFLFACAIFPLKTFHIRPLPFVVLSSLVSSAVFGHFMVQRIAFFGGLNGWEFVLQG